MTTSALVVTLSEDSAAAAELEAALARDPRFSIGERSGRRLPLALETPDQREATECWRWLQAHPGVSSVELLFVHFDGGPLGARPGRADSSRPHSDRMGLAS